MQLHNWRWTILLKMRDLVADAEFLLRKKIEAKLHDLYPDQWIPLYSMVTFHDNIRYSEALTDRREAKGNYGRSNAEIKYQI
jgi:hypothetical protein